MDKVRHDKSHAQLQTVAPSPRDIYPESNSSFLPVSYQKLPQSHITYLAYVVAIRDPLNFHLDIYWPSNVAERYSNALKYEYSFVSEELDNNVHVRSTYSCHLKGVEIVSDDDQQSNPSVHTSNMKEAYILMSKCILRSGGWVLVSVSDIDIYRRVLVNVFDVISRQSLNQELLAKLSSRTGQCIAREYVRPVRHRGSFQPNSNNIPKDYHIVYGSK